MRIRFAVVLIALGFSLALFSSARAEEEPKPAPIPKGVPTTAENVHLPTEGEIRLGRETAVEVEKHFKVVPSGPHVDRLNRVAAVILEAIERPEIAQEYRRVYKLPKKQDKARRLPFEYQFKVIDAGDMVNAFSLANGSIYVTKALLDFTVSDDELAGVLAHECAHVAFHHVVHYAEQGKKARKNQVWTLLAAVLAGLAGGGEAARGATHALMGAQLISIATLTGYGRDLEHEADRVGILTLAATSYHPAGMLTFMQKLAREDHLRGNPDFGIYQSHPYPNERVEAIRKQLIQLGYGVDTGTLRQVSGNFTVEAAEAERDGKKVGEVLLNGKLLFVAAAGDAGRTPLERAEKIAGELRELFASNLADREVNRSKTGDALLLRGFPVIKILPEDAAAAGGQEEALQRAYTGIMNALLKERLDTLHR